MVTVQVAQVRHLSSSTMKHQPVCSWSSCFNRYILSQCFTT